MTSEIRASNGNQVVAKSIGCTSINGKGVATFVVTSPQAQVCDLSFLMMSEYSLTPGVYIVIVEIDGNINAKKVIVK